ncbi:MAG: SDR family oxidoreductase [Hyphomicrobium sp.]|uniref:SDR family oxidoreductase n=1 Tax=Hyphomicrobium sp. TaxID=82 RepID=UPI003563926D
MKPIVDLTGKRVLVVGIANKSSIAYGCAEALQSAGADLAVTYLNAKAEPHVRPLAEPLNASIVVPCDVRVPGELEAVFETIRTSWGRLDGIVHSIAFAPREDLHNGLVHCSADGFAMAMDVSCHSFIRMAKLALPLMADGGSLQTVSFFGANRVVEHYNLMGPVKAASSGPVVTRAASGIDRFDDLLEKARERAPDHQLVTIEQIGRISAFLASDAGSAMTGSTSYADHGFHIVA